MRKFVLALATTWMIAATAGADPCMRLQGDSAFANQVAPGQRRVAFVAGVGAYQGLPVSPSSARDARVFAARLQQLGFDVVHSTDADTGVLRACFASYVAGAAGAKVQVLYFSGHGVQAGASNYLAARDARITGGRGQGFVPLASFIEGMAPVGGARIVILDASRPHGIAAQSVAFGMGAAEPVRVGLSPEEMRSATATSGTGQLVALSASPNTENAESGRMSVFTDALVDSIGAPGFSIQRVLSETARAVGERTNFARAPWTRSSLTEDVFLNGRLDAAALRAASEAFAGESERLLQGDRGDSDRALAAALKGLPLGAPADEPAFAAARRAYQRAARTVLVRLPFPRGSGEGGALVSVNAQRIAVLRELSFSLWAPRGPRKIAEIQLASDNARMGLNGRTSSSATMAFSSDGRHLAVFNPGARQVLVLDAQNGQVTARIASFATRAPTGIALANGGRRLLMFNGFHGAVMDAGAPTALFDLSSPEERDTFLKPAISPDGRELAVLTDASFRGQSGRAHTLAVIQGGARPLALHRFDLEAGRFRWTGQPITVRSESDYGIHYAPKGDYLIFTEPNGAQNGLRIFSSSNVQVGQGGPFDNRFDVLSPDQAHMAERDNVYAFPALTRVDPVSLAAAPVIHRVFGSDGGEFDFRIRGWPPAAPTDASGLEAARASLPATIAAEVAAQRLAYTRLAPPQK